MSRSTFKYAVPVAAVGVVAGYFLTTAFLPQQRSGFHSSAPNPHAAPVIIPAPSGKHVENTALLSRLTASKQKAVVVGGTGAVGKALLGQILALGLYQSVTYIGRRPIDVSSIPGHDRTTVVQALVGLDDVDAVSSHISGHDVVYCALGTTRGKAGKEGFINVDFKLVASVAAAAKSASVPRFSMVTATNSNSDSLFLYPQTKGWAERAVTSLGIPSVSIFRPAFLLTRRSESRMLEELFMPVFRKLDSWFPGKLVVEVEDVARAMLMVDAMESTPGDKGSAADNREGWGEVATPDSPSLSHLWGPSSRVRVVENPSIVAIANAIDSKE